MAHPTSSFTSGDEPVAYWHGLEMTKGSKLEAMLEGRMTVIADVAQ